ELAVDVTGELGRGEGVQRSRPRAGNELAVEDLPDHVLRQCQEILVPRRLRVALRHAIIIALAACAAPRARMPTFLEDMTWPQAERALTPDTVVVIPLGAASKEHGPHLRLSNDWLMADYLRRRLAERAHVVVTPIVGYSFYPA